MSVPRPNSPGFGESALLSTCRLIAGGALVLAGLLKMMSPTTFMLNISALELVPAALIPLTAYLVFWTELIAGALLLYGFWSRPAALVAAGMYAVFTLSLLSVIWRGMPVDCGCFGGMFGSSEVGWTTILRNGIFIAAAGVVVWRGGGGASLDAVFERRAASSPSPATDEAAAPALSVGQEAT